jgi:membrane-bound ClpP family serine protease
VSPLVWAILILALGLVLLLLELFIPSAGVLGFLAIMALVTSVVTVFRYEGMASGTAYLTAVVVLLAAMALLLIRWWPNTPIGRRILNLPRPPPRGPRHDDASNERKARSELVGQIGRAKTKMLPSGAIVIAGRTYDAVSQGGPIEVGQAVKVVDVRANRIVVRPTQEKPPTPSQPPDTTDRPLDVVVPDPFDDPLP